MPSLLHPSTLVASECATLFREGGGGAGCWISLSLVTSSPAQSHTFPSIPASACSRIVWLISSVRLRPPLWVFCTQVDHGSKIMSMLQASLKVQFPIFLHRPCKNLFWRHVQVGACVEVDNSNVKHRGRSSLPEVVGTNVFPQLCRYCYLSRLPY